MSTIYIPDEDSYLLEDTLKNEILKLKNKKIKILEIGVGSGIQLENLLELGIENTNIFGTDINFDAVLHCKKLGFNVWYSNLFDEVKGKYDIILFNPPYLPNDKNENEESKIITTGGKNGSEITNDFLKEAKKHLKKHGIIYLLTSSLSKENIDWLDYKKELINEKKLFFEKLEIWKLGL